MPHHKHKYSEVVLADQIVPQLATNHDIKHLITKRLLFYFSLYEIDPT